MRTVNTEELVRMLRENQDIDLIHVLGEQDFRKKHIRYSINVPVWRANFAEDVERKVKAKNACIVVYGTQSGGHASPLALWKLEQVGFRHVYVYCGGLKAWEDAGLPTEGEPSSPRTARPRRKEEVSKALPVAAVTGH